MDFDSLMKDPASFGLPTFEEFSKRPDHYVGKMRFRETETMDQLENGVRDSVLKRINKSVKHEILGYRVRTLAEVERIALDNGINLRDIKYRAAIIPMGGGDCETLVKWMSESDYLKRT